MEPKSLLHKDFHRVCEEVRALNLLQVMDRERIASMGRRRPFWFSFGRVQSVVVLRLRGRM